MKYFFMQQLHRLQHLLFSCDRCKMTWLKCRLCDLGSSFKTSTGTTLKITSVCFGLNRKELSNSNAVISK